MADLTQMSDSEKKKEDWMNTKWRPMMGWLYMAVCACDFILFPILHAIYVASLYKGIPPPNVPAQWAPLTLQGAGLFHMAMGAVLGIAAFGRTQEKIAGANNGGLQPTTSSIPTAGSGNFQAPASTSIGASSTAGGFNSSSTGGTPTEYQSTGVVGGNTGIGAPAHQPITSGRKVIPDQPQPLI